MPFTLLQTATNVCTRLGKTDSATLAICKEFVRNRYQLIFDSALWKESLTVENITTSSKDVILPHHMERVVNIRMGNVTGAPLELQNIFQTDPTLFDRTGTPTQWSHKTPVATLVLPNSRTIKLASDSTSDTGLEVIVRGESGTSEAYETITINGTTQVAGTVAWDNIIVLSKPETMGNVTVQDSAGNQLVYLWPTERERQHVRLLLHETPSASIDLMVLGKRRIRELWHDQDAPILRNIDNALIAFVTGDMLEWMRQYSKAQIKFQEGMGYLAKMAELGIYQENTVPQIIPASLGEWSRDDWS